MSFYTIQLKRNDYENFFENGIFDKEGMKDASYFLCKICVGKI